MINEIVLDSLQFYVVELILWGIVLILFILSILKENYNVLLQTFNWLLDLKLLLLICYSYILGFYYISEGGVFKYNWEDFFDWIRELDFYRVNLAFFLFFPLLLPLIFFFSTIILIGIYSSSFFFISNIL